MNEDATRNIERGRYQRMFLHPSKQKYGSTCHGRPAMSDVVATEPDVVVDFGCGRNDFVAEIRSYGIKAWGVDFAAVEADIKASLDDVPLRTDYADAIVCFDCMEHLFEFDVDAAIQEMKRIGKPGAKFWFSISTVPSKNTFEGEGMHRTVKPRDWWVAKISEYGVVDPDSNKFIRGHWRTGEVR